MTAENRRFFQELAQALADRGWFNLLMLDIAGEHAAALYNFRYGDTLYLYNSGYDPAFAQFSVGVAVFGLGIEWAIGQGLRVFDFMRGSEPYKYEFGPVEQTVHHLTLGRA